MVLVQQRLASFVFHPEADPEGTSSDSLSGLTKDENKLRQICRELTLRAFRVALEAENFKILISLKENDKVTLSELVRITGMSELLLGEKVKDLIQVGLASHALDTDQVGLTALAQCFMRLIEDTAGELSLCALERLADIIGK